jgi:7-carboxy-7-deazaguanine synthase
MSSGSTLNVHRVFSSIQGESSRAGEPCSFVRLAGCPLSCSYCDTADARDAVGRELTVAEIVARVVDQGHELAAVTGGEPLHQRAAPELLEALCAAGHQVLLETSGAFSIAGLDQRVSVVLDIKTPGSGMNDRMLLENLDHLEPGRDEVKFVITSRADFDWSLAFAARHELLGRLCVLISPASGSVLLADAADWIVESRAQVRLQPQLHKLIWGAEGDRR